MHSRMKCQIQSLYTYMHTSISIFKKDFIDSFDGETVREGTQAGGVGEGEAGSLSSREPDVGLNPRTLES